MHGIVFAELQKYVTQKLGPDAWQTLRKESGLGDKVYMAITEYPDAEALALVTTATRITGKLPRRYWRILAPSSHPICSTLYKPMVKAEWKTLELLEHIEETIHKVVRISNPGARPPELRVRRTGPDQVIVSYNSQRKICALAGRDHSRVGQALR